MCPLERMDAFFDDRADTYDNHMLGDLGLDEFYARVAELFSKAGDSLSLLDLGCGTGLELERLFAEHPGMAVTGIDVSRRMLDLLLEKFPGRKIRLVCGSYFDIPLGEEAFDYALSTYSLHHFTRERKLELYKRVHLALKPGSTFVLGDYMVRTEQEQAQWMAERGKLLAQEGAPEGMYHYDTPFTVEAERELLREAGFSAVRMEAQWENTALLAAEK